MPVLLCAQIKCGEGGSGWLGPREADCVPAVVGGSLGLSQGWDGTLLALGAYCCEGSAGLALS